MTMRVMVVGAGISGLSLAWYLKRFHGQRVDVTLIEKNTRLGGWIETIEREGYLFEQGPRSFRTEGTGQATLRLIEELGLQKALIQAADAARRRYLYTDGKLQMLPRGPLSLLFSRLTRPLLWPLLREWSVPRATDEESIDAFIRRRLGAYAAEMLFEPMTLGIYAGDIRQLSMQSCFPTLYQWEQEHGSLTCGLFKATRTGGGMFSLRHGMEQLVRTLAGQLDVTLRQGVGVDRLEGHALVMENGERLLFDRVYLALPSQALAQVLRAVAPLAARQLQQIPAVSATVVNLGYRRVSRALAGFGYLIPSREQEEVLGMVWDSSAFPQQNQWEGQTRLTVMLRGEVAAGQEVALDVAARHLGIRSKPEVVSSKVARGAIPQYLVGHARRLATIEVDLHRLPHVALLGSSLYGVSINDCIAHSCDLAKQSL